MNEKDHLKNNPPAIVEGYTVGLMWVDVVKQHFLHVVKRLSYF